MSEFSISLVELKKEKGLTNAQLGIHLGASDKTVSDWIRGVSEPRMGKRKAIDAKIAELRAAPDPGTDELVPEEIQKAPEEPAAEVAKPSGKKAPPGPLVRSLLPTDRNWRV